MSKASEWAKRLDDARTAFAVVREEKPEGPPDVYIVGVAHRLRFSMSDNGMPLVNMLDSNGNGMGGEVTWAEDIKKLKDAARWILDTFSDKA